MKFNPKSDLKFIIHNSQSFFAPEIFIPGTGAPETTVRKSPLKLGLYAALLALLITSGQAPVGYAADFKIKPLVLGGMPAPEGGSFVYVLPPELNKRGDIAFGAFAQPGTDYNQYLIGENGVELLLRGGTYSLSGRVPDPPSLGLTLVNNPCLPGQTTPCAAWNPNIFDNYWLNNKSVAACHKTMPVSAQIYRINDSRNVLIYGGRLFSGGSLFDTSCPTTEFIRESVYNGTAVINNFTLAGITNSGLVVLKLDLQDLVNNRPDSQILLVNSGGMTNLSLGGSPAPGGGTIYELGNEVRVNNNETLLVPFRKDNSFGPQGLLFISNGSTIPIAHAGSPAPGNRHFVSFSGMQFPESIAINDAEQAVFAASLSDGTSGIFRRESDGSVRILTEGPSPFVSATRSLSINDRGDVAAWLFFWWMFRQPSDIFLFSSTGGMLKIVGKGDPAPGGGTFVDVGYPRVNNKGEVVFWGVLSSGQTGIFLSSAGLEIEFVDPVPELLVSSGVTSDPGKLASEGRLVEGVAADGAARVVVRVKTGEPGTVEFSLVDSEGASLPANNLNGSLGHVGAATGSRAVAVQTMDVEGIGPMAFAAYHAPMDFAASPTSSEAGLAEREIFIKVKLTNETGETVESTKPLTIIRPPVVLVHGLWSNQTTWDHFGFLSRLTPDPRFGVFTVNYSSGDAVFPNADLALQQTVRFIDLLKNDANPARIPVAAVQADIVTHSMGGLVARTMAIRPQFFRGDNFLKGDIHKLITIDTPHLGSHFANRLLSSNAVCRLAFKLSGNPIGGAIEDLAVGSIMVRGLAALDLFGLKTHVFSGIASSEQELSAQNNFRSLAVGLTPRICPRILPNGGFQEVFDGPSDLLVSDESQAAVGLALGNGSIPGTASSGIIHSVIPKLFTLGPDALSRNIMEDQTVEVPSPNPAKVVDLLNQSVSGGGFAPIRP